MVEQKRLHTVHERQINTIGVLYHPDEVTRKNLIGFFDRLVRDAVNPLNLEIYKRLNNKIPGFPNGMCLRNSCFVWGNGWVAFSLIESSWSLKRWQNIVLKNIIVR